GLLKRLRRQQLVAPAPFPQPARHRPPERRRYRMTYAYVDNKEALIKRLHRIEGQVRGVERMVEDDRYCIDILTQIAAVNTALESLALTILEDHVEHCVAQAFASGDSRAASKKSRELLAAVRRFTRTRCSWSR